MENTKKDVQNDKIAKKRIVKRETRIYMQQKRSIKNE